MAATFIKAGFTVEFEDESDSSRSHCEYTVTHLKTGQKFSVEAKARGVETTLVRGLLTNALRKQADHTRLIWFAINWPATDADAGRAALFETLTELRSREDILIDGKPAPPAYVIVSNNPYEHAFDSAKYSVSALAEGFRIADMKYDQQFRSVREMRLNRDKHQPIHDLMQSPLSATGLGFWLGRSTKSQTARRRFRLFWKAGSCSCHKMKPAASTGRRTVDE